MNKQTEELTALIDQWRRAAQHCADVIQVADPDDVDVPSLMRRNVYLCFAEQLEEELRLIDEKGD